MRQKTGENKRQREDDDEEEEEEGRLRQNPSRSERDFTPSVCGVVIPRGWQLGSVWSSEFHHRS